MLAGIGLITPAMGQGAGERLAMPFLCRVDQGRVDLTPSPEQTYDVLDRREQQAFTACFGPGGGQCRAWMLQRFSISCQGQRVRAVDLMVAAAGATPFDVRLAAGHLFLTSRNGSNGRGQPLRECLDQVDSAALGPFERRAALASCWQGRWQKRWQQGAAGPEIELPAGFAPLGPLRARIVRAAETAGGGRTVATGARHDEPVGHAAPSVNPAAAGKPAGLPAAEPRGAEPVALPQAQKVVPTREAAEPQAPPVALRTSAVEAPIVPAAPNAPATTTIAVIPAPVSEASPALAAPAGAESTLDRDLLPTALLGAGAALATLAVLAWLMGSRRRSAMRLGAREEPTFAATSAGDAKMAELLLSGARDRLEEIRAVLETLPPAVPLRQVLGKELQGAEKRVQALAAERPNSARGWQRQRARLQAVGQELNRLREIASGAARTVSAVPGGQVPATLEPRDRAEAYAVLGINADADDGTLKKVVDGLRRAWHPDLAKDEDDRSRREQRMKQINVAWDLIQGRRAPG